jgi:hypothetical protein
LAVCADHWSNSTGWWSLDFLLYLCDVFIAIHIGVDVFSLYIALTGAFALIDIFVFVYIVTGADTDIVIVVGVNTGAVILVDIGV